MGDIRELLLLGFNSLNALWEQECVLPAQYLYFCVLLSNVLLVFGWALGFASSDEKALLWLFGPNLVCMCACVNVCEWACTHLLRHEESRESRDDFKSNLSAQSVLTLSMRLRWESKTFETILKLSPSVDWNSLFCLHRKKAFLGCHWKFIAFFYTNWQKGSGKKENYREDEDDYDEWWMFFLAFISSYSWRNRHCGYT